MKETGANGIGSDRVRYIETRNDKVDRAWSDRERADPKLSAFRRR